MDIFKALAGSSDPVVAILASLVVVQAGVIVFQWNYTANKTVPKWIWDEFVVKVNTMVEMTLIIRERLDSIKK